MVRSIRTADPIHNLPLAVRGRPGQSVGRARSLTPAPGDDRGQKPAAKRGVTVHGPGRRPAGRITCPASPAGPGRYGGTVTGCRNPLIRVWRPTMMRPCHRSSRRVNSRRVPAIWWRLRLGPGTASRNAPENTIARFPSSAYHGDMISRQAPKRPGYMNPAPRLSAAPAGGVVAW